jgi:DNA uptake protein and related DNA-binding proteins
MKRLLIPILIMLPFALYSQNTITDEIIIDQIERMVENTDDEIDYSELIEEYWTICENKININNPEELNQLIDLHLVNVFIVEKINDYRKQFGDFMMFEELQFVEGIDEMTLNILQPLVVFEKPKEKEKLRAKDLLKYGKHQTIFQMERCLNEKAGYQDVSDSVLAQNPNKKYLGSPNKLLLRYSFTSMKKLEFGFAMEKDAGEKNILDFVSFHFLLNDWKFVKTLALGDYQLSCGQGVTMGSGVAFAAGGGSLLRKNKKIRASKSANEARYLRGAATTLSFRNFELTMFYSNKKADANVSVVDSITEEPLVVTALQQTGLHRTLGELADRHAIRQQLIGVNLSYKTAHFQVGYTIHKTILSCELNPDPRLYNTFYFCGKTLANQGLDFYYVLKKMAFYGEAAISDNLAPAALIGTTVQPAGYIDFTVLYRYYDKKYQNFYSNAFAAGSGTRNEKGLYLSTSITFAPRWRLIATADFPQSDWVKTTAYAPSRTQDYNLQIEHQINAKALFFIQLRYKDKEKNGSGENTYMRKLIHERKTSLRFHITYPVGNNFVLKNRVEISINDVQKSKTTKSYLIYQDVLYNPENQPFSLAFRYMLFNSPVGAVYAYENDVLNTFAIGSFYHKGMRIYLLAKVKLRWGLSINAKIGSTIYSNVNEIGSGLELIEGNVKTDGKLQLVWKL